MGRGVIHWDHFWVWVLATAPSTSSNTHRRECSLQVAYRQRKEGSLVGEGDNQAWDRKFRVRT